MKNSIDSNFIKPMEFDEGHDPFVGRSSFVAPENHKDLVQGMYFDVKDKSPEEKPFILLLKLNVDNLEDLYTNVFDICTGRTEARSRIKELLMSGIDIDIHRSIVMTETKQTETKSGDRKYFIIPLNECISVYAFMTQIASFYSDDDFDIEEYNSGDVPEDRVSDKGQYLTPEQVEYRKMLEASMKRDKFINEMRREIQGQNI